MKADLQISIENTSMSQDQILSPASSTVVKSPSFNRIVEEKFQERVNLANECIKKNDIQGAASQFKKLLFLQPNNIELHRKYAEVLVLLNDITKALAHLRKSQQMNFSGQIQHRIYELMLKKGTQMLDKNEFDKYIQLHNATDVVDGSLLGQTPKIKETISFDNSEVAQQHFIRALAFLSENKRKRAIEELEQCTENDKRNVFAYILKAKIMWSINMVKQGYLEFWKASEIDPKHPEIMEFHKLAEDKVKQLQQFVNRFILEEDFPRSLYYIQKCLEVDPRNLKVHLLKAFAHRKQKDFESALKDLDHATLYIKIHPEYEKELKEAKGSTCNDYGIQFMEIMKYEEAIRMFTDAIEYRPDDWGVITNRGDCYLKMKNYEAALADYKEAADKGGLNNSLKTRFGILLYIQGLNAFNAKKYEECINKIEEALKFDKNNSNYLTLKGMAYSFIGNTQGAYSSLRTAVLKDPNHKQANATFSNMFQVASPKNELPRITKSIFS